MDINIIETVEHGLEDIPPIKTYYYGPKDTFCTRKEIALYNSFRFEILTYDVKGNGIKTVKIFTSDGEQIFKGLDIRIRYTWGPGYSVQFENEVHPKSARYFKFICKIDGSNQNTVNDILDKLTTIAEKRNILTNEYPSIQYVYAYIIYLFFEIKEEKIRAADFSTYFKVLKFMNDCIHKELTDNVNGKYFSTDNENYQKFIHFVEEQMEILKNKPINYYY